ncbi:sensor histidine kinase [Schleiferilactobacillus perolens]|nr:sensor histidine kinase KdpD [Schleiferilactobacillus perolens]
MDDTQPTPTSVKKRGQLKIFFGYAAGVGKTYQMLEEAHQLQDRGIDVVVGYVEPLARPETLALVQGLERLPQTRQYKGMTVNEFDLPAALARHPQVLLVDELAHTNTDQTLHQKRYQDVEELLTAGISVYTTMNVQHLESLNDIVEGFTHIHVREKVPDDFFDQADAIKLVDLDPQDLLERLKMGKIYRPAMAKEAMQHFFTLKTLTSLREIALRRMTMRLATRKETTTENLLVCFSGSDTSKTVLRSAMQLAHAFSGNITALYISRHMAGEKPSAPVMENIKLAEKLGMHVTVLYGDQRAELIAEYAKNNHISKLILGAGSMSLFNRLRYRGSIVDQLNQSLPDVDKYVIPHLRPKHRRKRWQWPQVYWQDAVRTVAILAVCTGVGMAMSLFHIAVENIILIYILGVMFSALVTVGRIASTAAAIVAVALFNYFFTAPYGSLASSPDNLLTFAIMAVVGLVSGSWTTRLRRQAANEAQQAQRTQLLLNASHELEKAQDLADIFVIIGTHIQRLVNRDVFVYPRQAGKLGVPFQLPEASTDPLAPYFNANERAVAAWSLKNNQEAGWHTDTLPRSAGLYIPIGGTSAQLPVAVLGIAMQGTATIDFYTRNLLTSIIDTSVLAIQRVQEANEKKRVAELMHQETTRANLLRGISHDLRTPLTTISGNADMLVHQSDRLRPDQLHGLYQSIYNDAVWLTGMVENLLAMTRFTESKITIQREPELVTDIVGEALAHVNPRATQHVLKTDVSDDLLMVDTDAQLIVQVLINIVNNAIQYTPAGSHITVTARSERQHVLFTIENDGPHIPADEQKRLFDLFYSKHQETNQRHGMGIGLALCRTIIQAAGGKIGVHNIEPRGVAFYFTLPRYQQKKGE